LWSDIRVLTQDVRHTASGADQQEGFLDAPAPWGGFGLYFLFDRACPYVKSPETPNWLFDENMNPRINSPGFVLAIQEIVDGLPRGPVGKVNRTQLYVDPNTLAFQQFLVGVGSMITWWGEIATIAEVSSPFADKIGFLPLPETEKYFDLENQEKKVPNTAPNTANIGWGLYVTNRGMSEDRNRAAWSAAGHLGGKDLSLWTAIYSSGFQPYRKSHLDAASWLAAGYEPGFVEQYLRALKATYLCANIAIEPRIPGILRYYQVAEIELARVYAGKETAKQGADKIAERWQRLTDQLGRKRQIQSYRIAMGL
jgi:multiple sugar transport system substrate-binding protein